MTIYEQMTTQKNRKCRPETILRYMLSTSYPQSTLSDLTLALAVHGGQKDLSELEADAIAMREVEQNYTLFDFVRVIEIKRVLGQITLTTKCYDIDPEMKSIEDNTNNHLVMSTSHIQLINGGEALDDVDTLATRLMEMFYRSQVKSKRPNESIEKTEWRYRVKEIERDKPGRPSRHVETTLDFKQALHRLALSLRKRSFHVILTQNCILLMDQKSRIYGVVKK